MIIKNYLPSSQYVQAATPKNQIYLHHTVSPSDSAVGDISWWMQTPDRVATHYIIDKFGRIYQLFDEKYWAFHLYVSAPRNNVSHRYKQRTHARMLDSQSIGIELDCAGPVNPRNGMFYTVFNRRIDPADVHDTGGYRGYRYFEVYHPLQLQSLEWLLKEILGRHPVIKEGLIDNYNSIFKVNENALMGAPGIYSHTSVRSDKSDCYPYPELVKLLNNLKHGL